MSFLKNNEKGYTLEIRVCWGSGQIQGEKIKCKLQPLPLITDQTRALSAQSFLRCFYGTKKGKRGLFVVLTVYACFLVTTTKINAPMTIMMMAIAMIPYMTVVFEAKPVSGVAAGIAVAAVPTVNADSADEE